MTVTAKSSLLVAEDGSGAPSRSELSGQRTLTAAVTAQLRHEIINGRLRPGSKLSISDTTKRLRVSLSATREALSRLASEGLVRPEEHKGYCVTPISIDDLKDLTQLRIEVDSLALRDAIKRGDAAWEARIVSASHLLSRTPLNDQPGSSAVSEIWADKHREFHLALISACQSPRLIQLHNTLFEQSERYRRLSIGYAKSPAVVNASHHGLVAPVLARDVEGAIAAIRDHFEGTTRVIVERETGRNFQLAD